MAAEVEAEEGQRREHRSGLGVDPWGNSVIDPTKNVLDLVRAEGKYQDAMREALAKYTDAITNLIKEQQNLARDHDTTFQNYAREAESKIQTWMRDAEKDRVQQLAVLRGDYEKRIADMLAESVRTTSDLVSRQLTQIQQVFNDRVSKLEEFRWSSTGRSSIADPARDEAMDRMAKAISTQAESSFQAMNKLAAGLQTVQRTETGIVARGMGRGEIISYITMGIMLLANIAVVLTFVLRH